MSLCHFVTIPIGTYITTSLYHDVTMSLYHYVTMALCRTPRRGGRVGSGVTVGVHALPGRPSGCLACPAGKYLTGTGLAFLAACVACPAGSFQVTMPLCHYATVALCHHVTMALRHYGTMSLCHFVTMFPLRRSQGLGQYVTLSRCHVVTFSLCPSVAGLAFLTTCPASFYQDKVI